MLQILIEKYDYKQAKGGKIIISFYIQNIQL